MWHPRRAALLASPGAQRSAGLLIGALADAVFADPARWHPVAGFGRFAQAVESRLYGDSRRRGTVFAASAVSAPVLLGLLLDRATRRHPLGRVVVTALSTWACLGGQSLIREGRWMESALRAGDLAAARDRLSHLCARDPTGLQGSELARATVESLAENTSDAVVAPLLWAAAGGLPGLLGYRAVNTLDAMVGYRSPRYLRFGWASARWDDALNLVPARLTAWLAVIAAPAVGGSRRRAEAVLHRDGHRHPSPNAGPVEAAVAGALGVRLGGVNAYAGHREERPVLGAEGRPVAVADIDRAIALSRLVSRAAVVVAAVIAVGSAAARCAATATADRTVMYRAGGAAADAGPAEGVSCGER